MKVLRHRAILGSLVIASTLGLASCSSSYGGVECAFTLHNVHESSGSVGYIDVKATGSCTGAADKATVTVGIQKLVNGSWMYVSGSQATRTIQPVAANVSYTAMSSTYVRCTPGTYRGTATGTLTVGGSTSPSYQFGQGPTAYVDCK